MTRMNNPRHGRTRTDTRLLYKPVSTVKKCSLLELFADCIGMTAITGEYLCWEPDGFLMSVDGFEIPIYVTTREFTFSDYPGDNDLKEGKIFHVVGRLDPDGLTMTAVQVWEDSQ